MADTVGLLLRAWRKQRRWSLAELALRSGISKRTLLRWEAEKTLPRMVELTAVLNALTVSSAQRQEAIARVEAPRAIHSLRLSALPGPPVSGDLLRAMRLRRRWTQQETAGRAGIAQATLARWERSEDWPSSERLHRLCYELGATEEELIALAQGFLTVGPLLRTRPDRLWIQYETARYAFFSPLADVEFLALEAQLWRVAQHEKWTHLELSYTYGFHARYLIANQRYAEAGNYVEHIRQLTGRGYRDYTGWPCAVLAVSSIAGARGRKGEVTRAIDLLREEIDGCGPLQGAYKAWMQSELALHLLKREDSDSSLRISKQAIRTADDVGFGEFWWRRHDHARLLLASGRYEEAVEECDLCLSWEEPPDEGLIFLLTSAEALIKVHRTSEAANRLQQVEGILARLPGQTQARKSVDALADQLSG